MGAHALPVVTAILLRDTAEVFDQHVLDSDTVVEQARSILEDVTIAAWKVGYLGSAENVSAVAEILSDYPDVPLVTYLPSVAWIDEDDQTQGRRTEFNVATGPASSIDVAMDGAQGRYTYNSMTTMRAYNRQVVTFQGTTGMIRLEGGPFNAGVNDMAEIELHKGGNRTLIERFPALNQYQLQVEAFGRSVREGAPFAWTLENAKGTQAMIDWAYREAVDVTI